MNSRGARTGPKPAAGTAREVVVTVRVTRDERREFKAAARQDGKRSVSAWLRNLGLERLRGA
jgi:hypothetical protein